MNHHRIVPFILFACCILCSCDRLEVVKNATVSTTSQFCLGQTWTFITPTNSMTNATLKVLRVNFDSGEGPIIFVHANGVQRHTWDVNIYVFSENALKRSVVSLVETNLALTDFEQRQFSSYYDTYQRGVKTYTFSKSSNLTVAEYLDQEAKH